jgi:hypothetical protein
MTEQPKEYTITTDMLLQWRTGCLRAMKPYNGDGDICPGCEFDNKKRRGCDFDDNAMQRIFQSRPVSTLPEVSTKRLFPTPLCQKCPIYLVGRGCIHKLAYESFGVCDAGITAIAQVEREKVLEENLALIRDVISKDQSGLAEALAKIQSLAKGYDWIPAGECGSYDYTQRTVETLQKECGYLLAEIEKIAYEGLRDSGNRVIAHVRFCEESLRQHKEQS